MDREALALAARRRQAEEALEEERERAGSLREEIERLVAELEGPRIDEGAFARMTPEDAELVRGVILPPDDFEGELDEDEEAEGEAFDPRAEAEEEIARLEQEIAESTRLQAALERYLEALRG